MKIKKIFFIAVFAAAVLASGFSQGASLANRRTALRCLNLAENYIQEQNWNAALSQCSLGINYDESISDLWYVLAAASVKTGKIKAEVLPYVKRALDGNNWVNYNKDAARLLYADILADTGMYDMVLPVLDETPQVFSADAEYVRIKALYRTGTAQAVSMARNKIDGASRIYPDDTRFPLLFFKFEVPDDPDKDVKRLSEYFLKKIVQYVEAAPDKDAELEIYASRFAEGELRERLLKSFAARDLRHPLYSVVALESGLISQKEAFRYLTIFADDSIQKEIVDEFFSLLTEEEVIAAARDYFTAYSGVLLYDTDLDGINNLFVKYSRGRPETVFYDKNQDGLLEWNLVCDFGVPHAGTLTLDAMDFVWNEYPYLESVKCRKSAASEINFYLLGRTLEWTPVLMQYDNIITQKTGFDFFFPVIKDYSKYTTEDLFLKASKVELTSLSDKSLRIDFVVLDGQILYADYFRNGIYFARANFENNIPVLRVLDSDGDGVFETTEFYSTEKSENMQIYSFAEEQTVLHNIYGHIPENLNFYLKMVQIDRDKDTIPDFTEEYFSDNSKISSWDTDGDGNFNVRHIINGENNSAMTLFYVQPENRLLNVTYSDGIPAAVICGTEELAVHNDSVKELFWIGDFSADRTSAYYELKAKEILAKLAYTDQASSVLVLGQDENYICIRIGSYNYALIVASYVQPEKEDAGSQEIFDEKN